MDEEHTGSQSLRSGAKSVRRPVEHRVHRAHNDVDVRIQEVGDGPAVLFLVWGRGSRNGMG